MTGKVEITTAGFGTMSMTWVPKPKPFEESIKTLNYVKDKYGVKFFNCSEFYHFDEKFHNLKLMNQFFKQLDPKEVGDLIIAIKGGTIPGELTPDGSKKNIDRSVTDVVAFFKDLPVKPKIIFEICRVDPNVPYEETIGYIYDHVKAGTIDGLAISEVGAESIKKAASIAPVSYIEVEMSLFTPDIIYNGVLAEASKQKIPIAAYSPLSRGLLTDYCLQHEDFLKELDSGDIRNLFDRFKPENFQKNLELLQRFDKIAKSYNAPLEVLALSYFDKISHAKNFEGIPEVTRVFPIPSASTIARVDTNYGHRIKISDEDLAEIQQILRDDPVAGHRYNDYIVKTGTLAA